MSLSTQYTVHTEIKILPKMLVFSVSGWGSILNQSNSWREANLESHHHWYLLPFLRWHYSNGNGRHSNDRHSGLCTNYTDNIVYLRVNEFLLQLRRSEILNTEQLCHHTNLSGHKFSNIPIGISTGTHSKRYNIIVASVCTDVYVLSCI